MAEVKTVLIGAQAMQSIMKQNAPAMSPQQLMSQGVAFNVPDFDRLAADGWRMVGATQTQLGTWTFWQKE